MFVATYFSVLFCPLAYPYQDDNSVAAATADGGNPYSSPLLELSGNGGLVESVCKFFCSSFIIESFLIKNLLKSLRAVYQNALQLFFQLSRL